MVNKITVKYKIQKFNAINFSLWKILIKVILRKDDSKV
jgi:hypothetical protein